MFTRSLFPPAYSAQEQDALGQRLKRGDAVANRIADEWAAKQDLDQYGYTLDPNFAHLNPPSRTALSTPRG